MHKLHSLLLLLTVTSIELPAQTTNLPADSAHFTISQGNHPVGRSDFSIQMVAQGSITIPAAYSVSSHGTISLQNTKYSFSGSGSLDKDLAILQESLNGTVNGSAVTFNMSNSGQNFAIHISANGKTYRNSLARPAQAVFFPDFDLASYEILLTLAARHPGAPISALIPKQTGILSAATLAVQADVQATFNGAKLPVHHASLTIGTVVSELYYAVDNRILEVDIPSQTFALVRDNFQLQPPPPPPAEPAPNTQQPDNTNPQPQPQ